jgi:hypothetical protein
MSAAGALMFANAINLEAMYGQLPEKLTKQE